METKKKKFFFNENDKSMNLLEILDKKDLKIIKGGSYGKYTEEAPPQYSESTYVRK